MAGETGRRSFPYNQKSLERTRKANKKKKNTAKTETNKQPNLTMENQAPLLWDSQELLDKAWKQLTDDGMKLMIAKSDGSEGIQKMFDTIVAGDSTLELELVLAKAQLLLLKMSHEKQASQLASKKK